MKRLFAAAVVAILVFLLVPFAMADSQYIRGVYNGFTYYFDANTGILYIRGQGDMPSFATVGAPWAAFAGRVTQIVMSEGISGISEKAFNGFTSLRTVTIPDTVTVISTSAFSGCSGLSTVAYSGPSEVFQQFAASSGIPELQQISIVSVGNADIQAQIASAELAYNAQEMQSSTVTATKKVYYNNDDDDDDGGSDEPQKKIKSVTTNSAKGSVTVQK